MIDAAGPHTDIEPNSFSGDAIDAPQRTESNARRGARAGIGEMTRPLKSSQRLQHALTARTQCVDLRAGTPEWSETGCRDSDVTSQSRRVAALRCSSALASTAVVREHCGEFSSGPEGDIAPTVRRYSRSGSGSGYDDFERRLSGIVKPERWWFGSRLIDGFSASQAND